MKLSIEQFERIDSYLRGQMSQQERLRFEEEKSQSPELQKEIQIHQELIFGLEHRRVRQSILVAQSKYQQKQEYAKSQNYESSVLKFKFSHLGIAAAIVIFIGLGIFYKKQYYISSEVLTVASNEIELKSYPFKLPSNISQSDKDILIKQRAEWFFALSFIKQKEKQKAKVILQRIVKTKNHPFKDNAKRLLEKL